MVESSSNWLKNIVGKGEITGFEQFLLFLHILKDLYRRHLNTMAFLGQGLILQDFSFNFLPNDKILDWMKLKAFADDKINICQKIRVVLGSIVVIVGKGENAGH